MRRQRRTYGICPECKTNPIKNYGSTRCRACYRKSLHGFTKHPLYNTWYQMLKRCSDEAAHNFQHYGGRGIQVCERWQSVANFIEDMGDSHSAGMTLDRVDNDGDYSPSNCRWATHKEQMNNTRFNHAITFRGLTMNIGEWADTVGIKRTTLMMRLNRYGWEPERALTEGVEVLL